MTAEDLDQLKELLRENGDADEAADFADRVLNELASVTKLEQRQQELLATIAKLSATTPYADEIAGWEGQRAAMLAEVGTLRSALHVAESVRDDARRVSQRYLDDKREAYATLTEIQRHLLNLLARIHRDGGHHTDQHGLTKSVADADLRVAELNCLADEARAAK
jgi:hypothetical protein